MMTLTNALAPLAKVQKNLTKFVAQSKNRIGENESELHSAKESFERTERRLMNEKARLVTEAERAEAVIQNLAKLLGK